MLRALQAASAEQINRITRSCPFRDLHDRVDQICYTQHLFAYLNPLTQFKQLAIGVRNPHLDNDVLDFVNCLPTRWRLSKSLLKRTVEHLLPEVSRVRFARSGSLINWDARFRADADLRAYMSEVLLKQLNGFDEIIDRRHLEHFLQNAFLPDTLWSKPFFSRVQKRIYRRQARFLLDPSTEIFRLMILKIWADEFLGGNFELAM